ncbi:hypothetical protein SAMN02745116_00680 [Pilibacter termitis]|uniref:Uncharacterized protein n=1 Tax=Pilibacter termitis TaxID=263852 RepID=A0A1T4LJ90_9ENTE|nr:hypothetical protein [Pilibacter termitis]SJZ54686.1 hypothetical protein SAMN02745116_00680 [Pilibacter termitis]
MSKKTMKKIALGLVSFASMSAIVTPYAISTAQAEQEQISQVAENKQVDTNQLSQEELKELYNKGITEGRINESQYPFNIFVENYESGKISYEEVKDTIAQGLSYNEYFAQKMNYGAFPNGEGHSEEEKQRLRLKRGYRENANAFKRDLRKGDILVVQGGLGHAAIATTNGFILEMSGGKGKNYLDSLNTWLGKGIPDNNHQFNSENWMMGGTEQGVTSAEHIKGWTQIWRLRDTKMAQKCADYADRTFWNSKGSYPKDRHIEYKLTSGILKTNPSYCSKMVYDAFYYGSGTAPLMTGWSTDMPFVLPAELPYVFDGAYKIDKIGTY